MKKRSDTINVQELPYSERQLVVVLNDDVVEASRKTASNSGSGEPSDFTAAVTKAVKEMFKNTFPFGTVIAVSIDVLAAWATARNSGVNILQIAHSEASSLQFPPGHPREQVLYVAHPAKPAVYYTMASFHRMAFEHKFSEAISLLMNLGASEIEVEHFQGWDRNFASQMATSLKDAEVNAHVSKSSGSKSSLLFNASFDNKQNPCVPEGLVWLPHEPTWQALADGRIKHGMNEFSLTVSYEDDFGVNAGLKLRVQKAGLDVGGKFEDHVATTWKIAGKFHPKK